MFGAQWRLCSGQLALIPRRSLRDRRCTTLLILHVVLVGYTNREHGLLAKALKPNVALESPENCLVVCLMADIRPTSAMSCSRRADRRPAASVLPQSADYSDTVLVKTSRARARVFQKVTETLPQRSPIVGLTRLPSIFEPHGHSYGLRSCK
jgi:hypothetical protein